MRIVKRSPLGEKEIIEAAPNRAVIEYLTDYDDQTDLEVDVFLNAGEKLEEKDFKRVLREGDILTLAYRPAGVETAILIAVVSALVLVALTPDVEMPNSVGETSSSSNNSVSGQSNTVRKYEAIPNIYGRVWSYPDLIANAVPEWISNRKQVRETFLVGEGEYDVHEIRQGSTDIDDISESSATVYGPNTYPSDLYRVAFSEEVDDEELLAADDSSLVWSGSAVFYNADDVASVYAGTGDAEFISSTSTVNFTFGDSTESGSTIGYSPISIEVGDTIGFSDASPSNSSVTVVSVVSQSEYNVSVTVSETLTDESIFDTIVFLADRSYVELRSASSIGSDLGLANGEFISVSYFDEDYEISGMMQNTSTDRFYIVLPLNEDFPNSTSLVSTTIQEVTTDIPNIVGPFTMPTEADQIWFNIKASSGLQSSSGGEISVTVTFYAQEIDDSGDDVGTPIEQSVTLTGDSTTQIGQTVKITGLGGNLYKVYGIRETGTFSGSAIQDVTWEEVFTVNSYSGENFGNVTVIDAVTKASTTGTTSTRNINADVTRKIDGVATTNFADAVIDLITRKGGRPLSEIDTVGLYEISDNLSEDLKEFSFTFDDKNISLAQAVQTACNVARVSVYRDGQMWRFNRDEAKPRTYVFNRRNLASGDNQTYTFSARLPNDYDSVALRYYNRDLESYDDVLVYIDSDLGTFTVGEDGERPYEIELAGCSNYAQALNRANLEARKIVYQRRKVEDIALIDAGNVDIGDRVAWCDIYDGEIMDGEIVGQDGTTFYTSEEINLESGTTYYAMITDQDGIAMTPVEVTAVEGESKAFSATIPDSVLIADGYEVQAGSKYIIGDIDDMDDTDYSVVGRGGNENGRISIELIQYNDNIYEMDT